MKKDAPELDRFAEKYCHGEITKAVEKYITENYDKLTFRSYIVKEPDGANLEDCRIEFTSKVTTYDKAIGFDAVVSADIEIFETVRGSSQSDIVSEWFRVPCQVLFEEKLERFRIHGDIEVYLKRLSYRRKNRKRSRLTQQLPLLSRLLKRLRWRKPSNNQARQRYLKRMNAIRPLAMNPSNILSGRKRK